MNLMLIGLPLRIKVWIKYILIASIIWITIGVGLFFSTNYLASIAGTSSPTICEDVKNEVLYPCNEIDFFLHESFFWIAWKFIFIVLVIFVFCIGFFRFRNYIDISDKSIH